MNVLVACEESQVVTIAFRKLGFRAFSCDVQMCSGGRSDYHILSDVLPLLDGNTSFVPYLSLCSSSKKMRSKTFPGIANAFAEQFSAAILSDNSFSLPYQTFLKDVIL